MSIRRAAATLLASALAVLLLGPASGASAEPHRTDRRAPVTVTISGYGWGHGKGLSQYGARNRAAAGQRYAEIIRAYYPGTRLGSTSGTVRVLVTADTSRDVIVLARSGLKAHSLGAHKTWRLPAKVHGKTVTRWKIVPMSGHRSKIVAKAGSWREWRRTRGDAEFRGGGPITLVTPHGHAAYRGILRSASANASGTDRDTVNILSLELYLQGVVPREMPASWSPAAVQAQAVAARTYAAFERKVAKGARYDLCDTAHCQVYQGYTGEDPKANAAIRATSHKVVVYNGSVAFTQFSASNGGVMAAGDFPYLRAGADSFDHGAPGDPWTRKFTGEQITRNWVGLGDLVSVTVNGRVGGGRYNGRATTLTVKGTTGQVTVSADKFQSFLGLRSALFANPVVAS